MKKNIYILIIFILTLLVLGYVYRYKLGILFFRLGGSLLDGAKLYETPGYESTQKKDPLLQQFAKNNGLPDDMLKYAPDHTVTDAEANEGDLYETSDLN